MPTLKNHKHTLLEIPKLPLDTQVFVVKATGEITPSYEEYLKRHTLYEQKVWICEATGANKLTFKEASISEKRNQVSNLPDCWMKPALEILNQNTNSASQVAESLINYFTENLIVDEIIYGKESSTSSSSPARVLSSTSSSCTVQFLNSSSSPQTLPKSSITRDNHFLTKNIFKVFIKQCATKDSYTYAPFIVKSFLLNKYKIPIKSPIKTPSQSNLTIKFKIPLKFPMDDLRLLKSAPRDLILPDGSSVPTIPTPTAIQPHHTLPDTSISSLLTVWNFLNVYGFHLNLSTFTLDEFIASLCQDTHSVLMHEIFGCLVHFACIEYSTRGAVYPSTLESHFGYLNREIPDICGFSGTTGLDNQTRFKGIFMDLSPNQKVCIDMRYRWFSGRWETGLEHSKVPDHTRLKAWSVVLVGLMKSWMDDLFIPEKWHLMLKLLGQLPDSPVSLTPEPVDMNDHISETIPNPTVQDSVHSRLRTRPQKDLNEQLDEEDELIEEEALLTPRKIMVNQDEYEEQENSFQSSITPSMKLDSPQMNERLRKRTKESSLEPNDQDIVTRLRKRTKVTHSPPPLIIPDTPIQKSQDQIELEFKHTVSHFTSITDTNFESMNSKERLFILEFLIESCVLPHDFIRAQSEYALGRSDTIRKELREIGKEMKQCFEQLKKVNQKDKIPTKPFKELKYFEEEVESSNIVTLDSVIESVNQPIEDIVVDESHSKERQVRDEERKKLWELQRELVKRQRLLEVQLKQEIAQTRIKPLGRDRYYNRYWWLDSGMGVLPFEEEKGRGRPKLGLIKPLTWTSGRVFVEMFDLENVSDPESGLYERQRLGLAQGRWGCYSTIEEIDQLIQALDTRGIRENELMKAIQSHVKDIALIINKRTLSLPEPRHSLYVNKLAQ